MNELVQLICIVSMDEHLSFGMMKLHQTGFVPYLFHSRTYTFYRNLHRSHNLLKSGISMYLCGKTQGLMLQMILSLTAIVHKLCTPIQHLKFDNLYQLKVI